VRERYSWEAVTDAYEELLKGLAGVSLSRLPPGFCPAPLLDHFRVRK